MADPSTEITPTSNTNDDSSNNSSSGPGVGWIGVIVTVCVLSVLVWCPLIYYLFRSRHIQRDLKTLYFRDKARAPELTYRIWTERREQAAERERARVELEEADREFRKYRQQRQDGTTQKRKRGSVFANLFVRRTDGPKGKAPVMLSTMSKSVVDASRREVDDEERLVEGGVGNSHIHMKPPSRRATWGSEMPPAYSAIALDDHEHGDESHIGEAL